MIPIKTLRIYREKNEGSKRKSFWAKRFYGFGTCIVAEGQKKIDLGVISYWIKELMDKDKIKKSCENFEALPLKAMRAVKEGARF